MDFFEIIEKKKKGQQLNDEEYLWFIDSLTKGEIKDYQAAALLMAIYINGVSDNELFALTKALVDTSTIINPVPTNQLHITIDKHSSGGVGDKVSLIISPILAALGYDVVKLSGRGLSFTGGTIDKLEAIGINYEYNPHTFQNYLDKTHLVLMLQSKDIVPGDKKLYALRDVTGTVDSLPLIAASIMSKKIVINSNYIFLDVKVGEGAFFKTVSEAEKFSEHVLKISKYFNRKTIIHLTDMSQPLGRTIGNAIEVKEAIDFLQNKFDSYKLKDLIFQFCADILLDTNIVNNIDEGFKKVNEVIKNGEAYKEFLNYAKVFSTDFKIIENNTFFKPSYKQDIYATQCGYLNFKSVSKLGMIATYLGAGRFKKEDAIDYQAGIKLHFDCLDTSIKTNDLIATLYSNKPITVETIQMFEDNLVYEQIPNKNQPIILKKIKA